MTNQNPKGRLRKLRALILVASALTLSSISAQALANTGSSSSPPCAHSGDYAKKIEAEKRMREVFTRTAQPVQSPQTAKTSS